MPHWHNILRDHESRKHGSQSCGQRRSCPQRATARVAGAGPGGQPGPMPYDVPASLAELAEQQSGVLTRSQALSAGTTDRIIKSRLDTGRWQRLHYGVYAAFSGPPSRQAVLWAAALRAGDGAALSFRSAAELDGLCDQPSTLIHVTVPARRRATAIRGVVVHSRTDAQRAVHPSRLPPRTRIEETVIDLADCSRDPAEAVGWITAAIGRRLTTQHRLRDSASGRSRLRWRADISRALSSDLAGLHSWLEYRYFRAVEAPHGLPRRVRQARARRDGTVEYRDVLYEEYAVAVELDGRVAHPGDTRWRDIRRDNAAAVRGIATLRPGYVDVTMRPCQVAGEVAEMLRVRGWQGSPVPCSATCAIADQPRQQ